jgi:hypothetical protein
MLDEVNAIFVMIRQPSRRPEATYSSCHIYPGISRYNATIRNWQGFDGNFNPLQQVS